MTNHPDRSHLDIQGMADYLSTQPDIDAAYIFGSEARGQALPWSDVDIAVLFKPGSDDASLMARQLELMGELQDFTSREVQVVILNHAPPQLAYEVVRHGRLLCQGDELARIRFEVRAMKLFFDIAPMLAAYDRALAKRIQEVGLGSRRGTYPDAVGAAERIYRRLTQFARR